MRHSSQKKAKNCFPECKIKLRKRKKKLERNLKKIGSFASLMKNKLVTCSFEWNYKNLCSIMRADWMVLLLLYEHEISQNPVDKLPELKNRQKLRIDRHIVLHFRNFRTRNRQEMSAINKGKITLFYWDPAFWHVCLSFCSLL